MAKTIQFIPQGGALNRVCNQLPNTNDTDFVINGIGLPSFRQSTRINKDKLIEIVDFGYPQYDYTEGDCPMLLNEPQKTNWLPSSEDFTTDSWVRQNVTVTPNSTLAPTVYQANASLIQSTSNTNGIVAIGAITSVRRTASIFAKKEANSVLRIKNITENSYVDFDLNNGTIISEVGSIVGKIKRVGRGFYRCGVIINTFSTADLSFGLPSANQRIFMFGAMLENDNYLTSYIPTLINQTFTRIARLFKGYNFGTYLNSLEGTIILKINTLGFKALTKSFYISSESGDLTNQNIQITLSGTNAINFRYYGTTSGLAIGSINTKSITEEVINMAIVYSTNRFEVWVNGEKIGQDLIGTTESFEMTRVSFCPPNATSQPSNFCVGINLFEYYDTALSEQEIIEKL